MLAIREQMRGRILDLFIQVNPPERIAWHPALTAYVMRGGNARQAAFLQGLSPRTVQRWTDDFLDFGAAFLTRLSNAQYRADMARDLAEQGQAQTDRSKILDALNSWCDLTHRESGGSGRTPDVTKRNHSGSNCPACAIKAGLFGKPGWGG